MLTKLFSFLLLTILISCKPVIVEKCSVNNIHSHDLTSGPHHTIKNSDATTNENPNDDFSDLDEGLFTRAGEYYLSLRVGAAGIPIDVVADTGSSDLLLSMAPSNSAKNLGQSLNLYYGTCSTSAALYSDQIGLACGDLVEQTFALMQSGSTCPNIMGLAGKDLSVTNSSFFDDLVQKNKMQNLFSMLLCGKRPGSNITLGGHIPNAPLAALQYIPITSEKKYYFLQVGNIGIKNGGALGTLSGQQVILDSGTTLSLVPKDIHDQIVSAIQAVNPNIPATFFTSTKPSDPNYTVHPNVLGDISKLPTITLELADPSTNTQFTLEIPPQVYLKDMGNANTMFGFRIAQSSIHILGQILMENYYVVFDRDNSRIGFAPNTGLCGT